MYKNFSKFDELITNSCEGVKFPLNIQENFVRKYDVINDYIDLSDLFYHFQIIYLSVVRGVYEFASLETKNENECKICLKYFKRRIKMNKYLYEYKSNICMDFLILACLYYQIKEFKNASYNYKDFLEHGTEFTISKHLEFQVLKDLSSCYFHLKAYKKALNILLKAESARKEVVQISTIKGESFNSIYWTREKRTLNLEINLCKLKLGKIEKKCNYCFKSNEIKLKMCSRCTAYFYCSSQCQKLDYKKHKKFCQEYDQSSMMINSRKIYYDPFLGFIIENY